MPHTTTTPRRRLDVPSLVLMLIGLATAVFAYRLTADHDVSALVIVPAVVAATIGATHLVKREAPRDGSVR